VQVFASVHPTENGDEVFANCSSCHRWAATGLLIDVDDDVLEARLLQWAAAHQCEDVWPALL
jgi:hypothetical protein